MYACMYERMYVRSMYVCMPAGMYVCMYVCMCVCGMYGIMWAIKDIVILNVPTVLSAVAGLRASSCGLGLEDRGHGVFGVWGLRVKG